MNIFDTALPEVKRVQLDRYDDARGFFVERFNPRILEALGIAQAVQLNHSRSAPGVLRGIHFQYAPVQGKLVGVTQGRVLDVAVDLRPHSPNYKKHVAVELSEDNAQLLWIPAGFGHGFAVLGDAPADMVYALDAPYAAAGEAGVRYDDPALQITWPTNSPILSARDQAQPTVAELEPQLNAWFR